MVLRLNSTLLVALPLLLFAAAHGLVSYSEWRTVSGSSPGNGGGGGPSNDGSLNSGGVPTVDPPVVSSPATGLDANGNPANLNLSTVIPVAPPVPIPTVVTPYGPRGADHYAHAVPPKLEPQLDEDGDEFAMVPLSSGNSHTHLVKDGKAGEITRYTWSKLSADEPPVVTEPLASGSSAIKRFPVGKTRVRLEVEDNGGNTHQDDFVVDVEAPVQNGVYCYYYKGVTAAQRLPLDPRSSPKPVWAAAAPTMDFADASAFPAQGVGAAGKAFAQRCVFSLRVGATAATTFSVSGSGAVTLAIDNIFQALDIVGDAPSVTVTLAAGNHPVQVMYFAEDAGAAKLLLRVNGEALATKAALWDMRTVVPVLTTITPNVGSKQGGTTVHVNGVNFYSSVYTVTFGDLRGVKAVRTSRSVLTVNSPPVPADTTVPVVVSSKYGGSSNSIPFTYDGNAAPIRFKRQVVTQGGPDKKYVNNLGAAIAVGPDGRLYVGKKGHIHVLTISAGYDVTSACKTTGLSGMDQVTSVAFNPADTKLQLYAATSIIYYSEKENLPKTEWNNGKIVLLEPTAACMAVTKTVVSGLPVSDHDHVVAALVFDSAGRLRWSQGSFTNMGANTPTSGTGIGGLDEAPLSAALLVAPVNQPGFDGAVKWACDRTDPSKCKQSGGTDVKTFATGVRNSFGMMLHTNGFFYATDNGPNLSKDFEKRSTSCTTEADGPGWGDKLIKITDGKNQYFGHPNRARGAADKRQCVAYKPGGKVPAGATKEAAMFSGPPSHNGVMELMSNAFADAKHSLIVLQSAGKTQSSHLVSLNPAGDVTSITALNDGGLLGDTDAHGAILMTAYFPNELWVLVPSYARPSAAAPPFVSAVKPHRGRADGGNTVTVGGHNFGAAPTATFGGLPCTNVRRVAPDGTSFVCTTPKGTKGGFVKVEVTTAAGRKSQPSAGNGDFKYMEV